MEINVLLDEAWIDWQRSIKAQYNSPQFREIDNNIMQFFQATKHLDKVETMAQLTTFTRLWANSLHNICLEVKRTASNVHAIILGEDNIRHLRVIPIAEFEQVWYIPVKKGDELYPPNEAIDKWLGSKYIPIAKSAREKLESIQSSTAPIEVIETKVKEIPRFSWSYTSLSDYETCPMKMASLRYYKTTKHEDTEQSLWGTRKHKAQELAFKEEFSGLEEDLVEWDIVNAIKGAAKDGELLVEHQITLTRDLKPTDWFAKDAYARAIIDVAVIKDNVARVYDFKTGKEKDLSDQLKIFCIFMALARKDIESFIARDIWLKTKNVSTPIELKREDLLPELKNLLARVERFEHAWNNEIFPPIKSGLCRQYCPVLECAYNGRRV